MRLIYIFPRWADRLGQLFVRTVAGEILPDEAENDIVACRSSSLNANDVAIGRATTFTHFLHI